MFEIRDSQTDQLNGSGYATKKHVHRIDCDAPPFVPEGWFGYEKHRKGGQLAWDPTKIALWLSEDQRNHGLAAGEAIRSELAGKPVLNANVLDYLLANQHLIPKELEQVYVLFWGTEYYDLFGKLCVRYLYKSGARWYWSSEWVDDELNDHRQAALYIRG